VTEQRLGLELGQIEVGPTFLHGGHDLGGVAAQLDGANTVAGCKLAQEASPLSE